ncbi:HDIG domain-containing protein [Desulfonatronum thiosulfatophilum]|uniref:HDIG domain-containing protein n=1 Tax=Desulfonatronum thiosulfatophilum TaxID=617002 RepID=A0A1G6A9E8_9BACT|nr:HD domain-containing protein [Desulfonatronum thiosulfatophilum]SDB04663.1 HDIG domain-containing protein [Desulfonatronum thiosulfatophilum]
MNPSQIEISINPLEDERLGATPGWTPTVAECRKMWELWDMPEHIQSHSLTVTRVSQCIAELMKKTLLPDLDVQVVTAAAMLHDLAKFYTILHGGSHSQIGAAWVQEQTRNPVLTRAVLHHVHWPFAMNLRSYPVSLIVCYSDKRVMHTEIVTLEERFADLQTRYGMNATAIKHIQESLEQGQSIERLLSAEMKVEFNAYSFDCRRMV